MKNLNLRLKGLWTGGGKTDIIFLLTGHWLWLMRLCDIDTRREGNTHAYGCRPGNFKNWAKILKSDFQGVEPKYWHLQNQDNSPIQYRFLKIKKIVHTKKLCRFHIPEFNLRMLVQFWNPIGPSESDEFWPG